MNDIITDWKFALGAYTCPNNNVWDNWNLKSLGPIIENKIFPPKLITDIEPHYNLAVLKF